MTVFDNKYYWKSNIISSRIRETLLYEGLSLGYRWAIIKYERIDRFLASFEPRGGFIVRVDISEWYNAWNARVSPWYKSKYIELSPFIRIRPTVQRQCPGWWNNGYRTQLCVECTFGEYKTDVDRFMFAVQTGIDADTDHVIFGKIIEKYIKVAVFPLIEAYKTDNIVPVGPFDDF